MWKCFGDSKSDLEQTSVCFLAPFCKVYQTEEITKDGKTTNLCVCACMSECMRMHVCTINIDLFSHFRVV